MFDIPIEYSPPATLKKILKSDQDNPFQCLPDTLINALSVQQCFMYVGHIKTALLAKYGNSKTPEEPIDEARAPNELATLLQIQNRLTLSDAYQNFVIKITKKAAEEFTNNTRFVTDLLEWNSLSETNRIILCQHFHDTIINFAKAELKKHKGYEPLAESVDGVFICKHYKPPVTSQDGTTETIAHGSAAINHRLAPGCEEITVNTHEKAGLQEAVMAMHITAHETAHVIEGLFSFMHGHNANFIPPVFQKDAEMLFTMHDSEAYVNSNIRSIYEAQANEKIAEKAANKATPILRQAIMDRLHPDYRTIMPRNFP